MFVRCVRAVRVCVCVCARVFERRTFVAGGKTVPLCDAVSISLSTCLHERLHLNPVFHQNTNGSAKVKSRERLLVWWCVLLKK